MTTHRNGDGPHGGDELPPLVIPQMPSERRKAGGIAECPPARPREAEPGPQPSDTPSPPPRDRQSSTEAGIAVKLPRFSLPSRFFLVAEIADILNRQPWSLEQTWQYHTHAADIWRPAGYATAQPAAEWDGWPAPVKDRQPAQPVPVRGPPGWMSRLRLAWGCLHIVISAVLLVTVWALETVPRALLTAGAIALAIWLI